MLNKEHSYLEGIQKAVSIKYSLNLGLSKDLKEAFPLHYSYDKYGKFY